MKEKIIKLKITKKKCFVTVISSYFLPEDVYKCQNGMNQVFMECDPWSD